MALDPGDFQKLQGATATAARSNFLAEKIWRLASGMSASPEELIGASLGVITVLCMQVPEPKRALLLQGIYKSLEANITGKDLIHVPLTAPAKNP